MMEFTNASLEKVNNALKVVNEFTAEVIVRAQKWLEQNWRDDYDLPDPHIIFNQEGWVVRLADTDKALNDTTGAPVKFVYNNPALQPMTLTFEVPAKSIFTEDAEI